MTKIILITLILYFATLGFSKPLEVKYVKWSEEGYYISLLKNALNKTTSTDGPYELRKIPDYETMGRRITMLEDGHFDIIRLALNKKRYKRLLAIKIPLLQGLLGYRIFLIHKDSINNFRTVKTLGELKAKFNAGFGSHWADMKILRNNGIRVDGAVALEHLYRMLAIKRFDYFPRSIEEIWQELEVRRKQYPEITIERNLCLYYDYPAYFFVRKQDIKLADRIERGLQIALKDKSFKRLFLKYHIDYIKNVDLPHRKLFKIENHTLPEGTKSPDTTWWLNK